ncbi:MAG TPA: DUF4399 domain-containing protein [Pseudomonadales bacterium]|nr:DUF4399 domain-containing protein [Pseudomonadales bacterium]
MKTFPMMIALMLVSFAAAAADVPLSPSPAGASVFFVEPADGATVPATFTVKFGVKGMTIAPAGTDQPNSGHHHLLIDVAEAPDMKQPLPANEHVVHFGKGQTETQVTLPPGKHTLQLVFANYLHIPHDPPVVSKQITVTVK